MSASSLTSPVATSRTTATGISNAMPKAKSGGLAARLSRDKAPAPAPPVLPTSFVREWKLADLEPQLGEVALTPGDAFLLCTDGVVDGLWDRQLEETVRAAAPDESPAMAVVTAAVENSGRDNATALVVTLPDA